MTGRLIRKYNKKKETILRVGIVSFFKKKLKKKGEQIEYNNMYAEGRAFGEKGYRSKKFI